MIVLHQVTLTAPLAFNHTALGRSYGTAATTLDMRAEVGLLDSGDPS